MRIFIILIILTGCSNLEYVYEKNKKNPLFGSTVFVLSGDQNNVVSSQLNKIIGKNNKDTYDLEVETTETIKNEVVGSDSATTKYNVSHALRYVLKKKEGCIIFKNKITTMINYDSKSAGYNFGSDISKSKNIEINIGNNIRNFMKSLELLDLKNCINEG